MSLPPPDSSRSESVEDSDFESAGRERPELASRLDRVVEALHAAGDHRGSGGPELPRVAGFEPLRLLGQGGMGVVWLAEQLEPSRQVALKVLHRDRLGGEEAVESRFRREIESVARLSHSNIVQLYEIGSCNGAPWFSQEYVPGLSLSGVLRTLAGSVPEALSGADLRAVVNTSERGTPSDSTLGSGLHVFSRSWIDEVLAITRQVALALQHAHERGVVHRDVKPGNVLLTPTGRAVLVDFGLAKLADGENLTRTGAIFGSLQYMSPEALRGASGLDAATDIYSLGVTLFELLTLRRPYPDTTAEATCAAILEGSAPSPRDLNPAVSREVTAVCLTAIDPVPKRRYASARAFADDLQAVLECRAPVARPAGPLLRARRWCQRHPERAVALVLGIPLLIGTPTVVAVQSMLAAREERRLTQQVTLSWNRSEADFKRAVEAIDVLLRESVAVDLRDVAGVARLRSRMIERALAIFGELEAQRPADDPLLRELRAKLGETRADSLQQLGRNAEAAQAHREVAAQMAELAARDPAESEWAMRRVKALYNLGLALVTLEQREEAREVFVDALSSAEALGKEGTPLRLEIGFMLRANHAENLRMLGEAEESEHLLRQVAEQSEILLAAGNGSAEAHRVAFRALYLLSQLELEHGRNEAARELMQRALELTGVWYEREPFSMQAKRQLGLANSQLGLALMRADQPQAAREVLELACKLLAELLATEFLPELESNRLSAQGQLAFALGQLGESESARLLMEDVLEGRRELAKAGHDATGLLRAAVDQLNLGTVLLVAEGAQRADLEQALDLILASRAIFEQQLAKQGNAEWRWFFGLSLVQEVAIWSRLGDLGAAGHALERHAELGLRTPMEWFAHADAWAEWTRAARVTASSAHERDSAWDHGRTKALDALEKAIVGGFQNAAVFSESDALQIFTDEPGFQALLKRLR